MEIVAALAILVGILSTALVVMNNAVEATVEMRARWRAFEVARENLESLLTVTTVSDMMESGYSEKYPEIRWELRVEPFYEPISNKMWIRAVSSAGFGDGSGQEQTVELEQWLTGLSAQQVKQILDQQEIEEKILKELYGDQDSQVEEMTKLCLTQAGLNVSAYESFLRRQRREKLDYLIKNGFGQGYDDLLAAMENELSQLLVKLGADFNRLNDCIAYLYANPQLLPSAGSGGTLKPPPDPSAKPDEPDEPDGPDGPDGPKENEPTDDKPRDEPAEKEPDPCADIDCGSFAPELRQILCQLIQCCCG